MAFGYWMTNKKTGGRFYVEAPEDTRTSLHEAAVRKKRQIEQSKKEAERNRLVEAGYKSTYHVYRAGNLDGGLAGMVYFSPEAEVAKQYTKGSFNIGKKKYSRKGRQVNEYDIKIENPLVISKAPDATAYMYAVNRQFYPQRWKDYDEAQKKTDTSLLREYLKKWAKEDGYKITGNYSTQIYLDTMNAKALKNSKYDSIIYLDATKNDEVHELIVLPNHKSLKKKE